MKQKNEKPHSQLVEQLQIELRSEVLSIVRVLGDKSLTVGFAESCTGGLLSSYFTELAGVSSVFVGSIISYDNKVKQKFLMVSEEVLKTRGAVSFEVAKQMAEGAVTALGTKLAVSITGIAGPSGGSSTKPVGTVFIAVAGLESETKSETQSFEHHFDIDGNGNDVRKIIQLQSCIAAVKHLNEFVNNKT